MDKVSQFSLRWQGVAVILLLALLVVMALSAGATLNLMTRAQEPKAKPTPTVTATPIVDASLNLTKEELAEIEAINVEAKPLADEFSRAYRDFITSKTAADRCRFADHLWIANSQLKPLQDKQQEWLNSVRKAHKCFDCAVENGRLLKPKS